MAGLKAAREAFYTGEIAHQIATFVQRHGGLLDVDDLAAFETKVETPVSAHYRGYDGLQVWSLESRPGLPPAIAVVGRV